MTEDFYLNEEDWQQLTDGASRALVQLKSGSAFIFVGEEGPEEGNTGFFLSANRIEAVDLPLGGAALYARKAGRGSAALAVLFVE